MKVCVVGAGASGLVMTKELLEAGHNPVCAEASPSIGGVFVRSYENTKLTSSTHMTAFSDFPPKCKPNIWTAPGYVQYLEDYCAQYDILRHVRFNTKVTSIQRLDPNKTAESAHWVVVFQTPQGMERHVFDNVVISTGTHSRPKRFKYKGQEAYEGTVIHSGDIKGWARFDKCTVVSVGMGESGADVALEVAKRPGAKVAISLRGGAGWITARFHTHSLPQDMLTNRFVWGLPRPLGWLLYLLDPWFPSRTSNPFLRKRIELNRSNPNTDIAHFGTFGTKTTAGVQAIVQFGAELRPDIAQLGPGRLVTFTDGSSIEADYVVQNTGFEPRFDFLDAVPEPDAIADDHVMAAVRRDLGNIRRSLYKKAIHPALGLRLLFLGFVRPAFGALPPLSEMQARWYVAMLDGASAEPLPPEVEMRAQIEVDAAGEEFLFRKGPGARNPALVDHVVYFNDLATLTGCRPPLLRLLLSDPRVLWKLWSGPHAGAQFRLAGVGAKPEIARSAIMTYAVPLSSVIAVAAAWAAVASLYILLLPLPEAWVGDLRNALCPLGFANSRQVFNRYARGRLSQLTDLDYHSHAVRDTGMDKGLGQSLGGGSSDGMESKGQVRAAREATVSRAQTGLSKADRWLKRVKGAKTA